MHGWLAQADAAAGAVDRVLQAGSVEDLLRALVGVLVVVVVVVVAALVKVVRERDTERREENTRLQRTIEALTGQGKGDSRG
ncbi:MAG: hypothetical protein KIT58_00135 [Planctomycetota bacterium]|nr:hypothetical protein [Planctomycetota bacterium]